MKIATWNINSVRLRMPLIEKYTQSHAPDILCLQETKVIDELFPYDALHALGYEHIHIHGMKSYNGVAILSKMPFRSTEVHHRVGKEDCRHISINLDDSICKNGMDIHCLYIPAGGDEPDRTVNEKFGHKLDFLDEMNRWFQDTYTPDRNVVAVGDFNIAPLEQDVWSHKQLLKVVSHTPVEVGKLTAMQDSIGWVDAMRHFVPEDEKCYTWWSYRNRDWTKSNRGRRLDHIWVTEPLRDRLKSLDILTEARSWEKPSDHVPVMVDLDL